MYRSITNIQYFISTFSIKRIFNNIVVCSGACLQGERVPSSTLSVLPKCFVRCDSIRLKKILGNVRSPSQAPGKTFTGSFKLAKIQITRDATCLENIKSNHYNHCCKVLHNAYRTSFSEKCFIVLMNKLMTELLI